MPIIIRHEKVDCIFAIFFLGSPMQSKNMHEKLSVSPFQQTPLCSSKDIDSDTVPPEQDGVKSVEGNATRPREQVTSLKKESNCFDRLRFCIFQF